MKTSEKNEVALQLSPAVSEGGVQGIMPDEFGGIYQTGFECGYSNGRETGYRQGFSEGYAAAQEVLGSSAGLAPITEAQPGPKHGPRRMLLGMPCTRCKVYLLSGETHCPCCK